MQNKIFAYFMENRAFTLIETLIVIGLMIIVFTGIYGAFQAAMKMSGQSKSQVVAIALANQKIEEIRNLSYNDVGTIGGIPSGNIPQIETTTTNNVDYTIKTTIIYIDDPFDGLTTSTDSLPRDYKRVKVKVSWPGFWGGEVSLISDIAPKGIETEQGGGTLIIWALNASGQGIAQADIHLYNDQVSPKIDAYYQTNDSGFFVLAGVPTSTENYKTTIVKNGYSQERTYGKEEVVNPVKPHLSVFERQLTEVSFSIDKLSSFSIETRARESFDDDFENYNKLSDYNNISISAGEVKLAEIAGYATSGYLISQEVSPNGLINWDRIIWQDQESGATDIKYQVFYATDTIWNLVPEIDLPGNVAGFDESPIDISNLDISNYPKLKIKGNLSTSATSTTPVLFDWHLIYNTPLIANVDFHLQGLKIIGTNAAEEPVYKYNKDHSSDFNGKLNLLELEWDSYLFSATTTTNMDLVETIPSPQPINLLPATTTSVKLYFKAENSLLIEALDASTSDPIFGADVRVYNTGLGYDKSKPSNEQGQTYFIPLEQAVYDIEIIKTGYQTATTTANVFGKTFKTINLVK